jgi:hypothetical protein
MKVKLLVTQPTTVDLTLKIGDVFKSNEPFFQPLIEELDKIKLVGSDTSDWIWTDFFHRTQINRGDNGSHVTEIEVLNTNNGSDRVTLKLSYGVGSFTIAILEFPPRY